MFGINGGEALVLLLVIAIVVGPERLPQYTEQLANGARTAKRLLTETKERMSDQAPDVDWAAIDPRRYDPRRIVRDALLEDDGADARESVGAGRASQGAGAGDALGGLAPGAPAPYDDEAT